MNRLLALILAAILLAASLASCAVAPEAAFPPNVRLTSSDAADAAAWLAERLGERLTATVVLGTDADGYGVDVSALEADGYVIRSLGGEDVLLAKTADGLDRAVRRYAKAIESGTAIAAETYHEGARIKKLTIAGRDISEYTIVYHGDYALARAAEELRRLIEKAVGVRLAISTGDAQRAIEIRYVHDNSLGNVGYVCAVGEDGVTLECSDAYPQSSPMFAVWRFLENELDWFGLTHGDSMLESADHIDICAGTRKSESPAFRYFELFDDVYADGYLRYRTDRGAHLSYGDNLLCSHDIESRPYGVLASKQGHWRLIQPCYMSEDFYEYALEDILDFLHGITAQGHEIPRDYPFVGLGMPDNTGWCACKDCTAVYLEEGRTRSATVVRWANRTADALNEEFPGLLCGIYAYAGSNKAPLHTGPNEHVAVHFCFDMVCSLHPIDGSECFGRQPRGNPFKDSRNNADMTDCLKSWLKYTDLVSVRPYWLPDGPLTMDFICSLREDIRTFAELGVYGVFYEAYNSGYDFTRAAKQIGYALQWDIDMTDGEYDALVRRVFRNMYGDGWEYVYDYHNELCRSQKMLPCATSWFFDLGIQPTINFDYYARNYDKFYDMLERAKALANDSWQERILVNLQVSNIYKGSVSSYARAYEDGDDERCDELCERYATIAPSLAKYGVDFERDSDPESGGDSFTGLGKSNFKADLRDEFRDNYYWKYYLEEWFGFKVTRRE